MGFNTFPCNPYPISTEELNKGNNDDLNTRVTALESDVSDLNNNKANQITIAPFFNAETAYTAGDLVYYNGLTYRCTNDHEGAWDADDFAATTISNELDSLKSGLTNLDDEITVYHKRYHGGDLWAGDTLTFNNVSASSNIVYHFVAIDTTAAGTPESAYILVKSTGVQVYGKVGTFTTAYDAEHETLTITLPSSSYWAYRLEIAARRND